MPRLKKAVFPVAGFGTWGLVASIVANAYIGTGLAAAGMLFYRARLLVAQNKD